MNIRPRALIVAIVLGTSCLGFVPMTVAQQRDEFESALKTWKDKFKELVQIQREFLICEQHEADPIRERWRAAKAAGDALQEKVIDQALAFYEVSNIDDAKIREFLKFNSERLFQIGQYQKSAFIRKALLKHEPDNFALMFDAVRAAFLDNEHEMALDLIAQWKSRGGEVPPELALLADYIEMYQSEWKRELELREQDKDANLPRLELVTGKGKIVVELYEDQAENAVNLFVFLTEGGFYRDKTFFDVIDHQYALTGSPNDNSNVWPTFGIASEADSPDARKHFRGTISLRVKPDDNTIRSQFYLLNIPIPDFDGRNVVIGRVIEGMDIVDSLNATLQFDQQFNPVPVEDVAADRLISINVLRKRDHEYQPVDVIR